MNDPRNIAQSLFGALNLLAYADMCEVAPNSPARLDAVNLGLYSIGQYSLYLQDEWLLRDSSNKPPILS